MTVLLTGLAVYAALATVATLACAVLAWRHWRANAPTPDGLTQGFDATAEPERDHHARAKPLHEAETGWLLARRLMLDQQIRRNAQQTAGLLMEHDRISGELCLRGMVTDGAADLEHYANGDTT